MNNQQEIAFCLSNLSDAFGQLAAVLHTPTPPTSRDVTNDEQPKQTKQLDLDLEQAEPERPTEKVTGDAIEERHRQPTDDKIQDTL